MYVDFETRICLQMTRLAVFNVSQSSKPDTKNSYDTDSDSDSEFNHRMEKVRSSDCSLLIDFAAKI